MKSELPHPFWQLWPMQRPRSPRGGVLNRPANPRGRREASHCPLISCSVAIEGHETNEILTVRNLRDNQVTAPDSENLLI